MSYSIDDIRAHVPASAPVMALAGPVVVTENNCRRIEAFSESYPGETQGQRDNSLSAFACRLAGVMTHDYALVHLEALLQKANLRNRPPLPAKQVEGIARGLLRQPEKFGTRPHDPAFLDRQRAKEGPDLRPPSPGCSETSAQDVADERTAPEKTSKMKPGPAAWDKILGEVELIYSKNRCSSLVLVNHPETGVRNCLRVKGKLFKLWLTLRYMRLTDTNSAPKPDELKRVIEGIEATAQYSAPKVTTFLRIAHVEGRSYLETCRESGEVLEMAADAPACGWRLRSAPEGVYFESSDNLAPLPLPAKGGDFRALQRLFDLEEPTFRLICALLVHYASGIGPFVIALIQGPQGSGKTSLSRMMKSVLDPAASWQGLVTTMPTKAQDLWLSVKSKGVSVLDNTSYLSEEFSDTLCVAATGGSRDDRELYTNEDIITTTVMTPIMITGVAPRGAKPDFYDRCISITLQAMPASQRRDEASLIAELEELRPGLLGCICRAVSIGLKMRGKVPLPELDRMGDFCRFIIEAEAGGAFPWEPGGFMEAYRANRAELIETTIENDSVGEAVKRFMLGRISDTWEGTAGDLARELPTPEHASARSWPPKGHHLTRKLRELGPFLARVGIQFEKLERTNNSRLIRLRRVVCADHDPTPEAQAVEEVTLQTELF